MIGAQSLDRRDVVVPTGRNPSLPAILTIVARFMSCPNPKYQGQGFSKRTSQNQPNGRQSAEVSSFNNRVPLTATSMAALVRIPLLRPDSISDAIVRESTRGGLSVSRETSLERTDCDFSQQSRVSELNCDRQIRCDRQVRAEDESRVDKSRVGKEEGRNHWGVIREVQGSLTPDKGTGHKVTGHEEDDISDNDQDRDFPLWRGLCSSAMGSSSTGKPQSAAQDGEKTVSELSLNDLFSARKYATSNDSWRWKPDSLRRSTCPKEVREDLIAWIPDGDEVVFRYCVYVLWGRFRDWGTGWLLISRDVCEWIGHHRYETALEVLNYIESKIPRFRWAEAIPKQRCRQIIDDGLPQRVREITRVGARNCQPRCSERVYVLTGESFSEEQAALDRKAIQKEALHALHNAPSEGALKTVKLLNHRPSHIFARTTEHIPQAVQYVRKMNIEVQSSSRKSSSRKSSSRKRRRSRETHAKRRVQKEEQLRERYLHVLDSIRGQHQPFYTFSRKGRTDRVFALNKSALNLPKAVREILYQDFYEVDLRSAHLLIAAWLWDAEDALEKLSRESFSIWCDLMRHCEPLFENRGLEKPTIGDPLYAKIKSAFKVALYSTVYGMPAPNVQAGVTQALKPILGPTVGEHLRGHPIIVELLRKRDDKLKAMQVGDTIYGPTGIEITIQQSIDDDGDGVDPKSAMATLAQSYEQALMQVILEYEKDRNEELPQNYFRVALWLHDGAYVHFRGTGRARMKELNQRLQRRCEKLAGFADKGTPLPAFFEKEKITPPSLPEVRVEDYPTANRDRSSAKVPATTRKQIKKERSPSTDREPRRLRSQRTRRCVDVSTSER